MNHPQQQHRAMMHHAAALAHQNQNQLVRTFDLEEERPVDKKRARDELTTYTIYRFEADGDSELDAEYDYGKKKTKSWARIKRTEVLGLEKRTIAREIWDLENDNGTLIDKKKTLASPLQEVLEKTLQELQHIHNHPLFETNLVQLDRCDAKRYRDSDEEDRHRRATKTSHSRKLLRAAPRSGKKRSERSPDKAKRQKKKNKQPVSILAYYKTSPLSTADPINLYYQSQAKTQQLQMQPPQPEFYHLGHQGPSNPGSFHHEGPPRPQGGGGPRGPEGPGGGARVGEGKGSGGPPARALPGDGPPRGQHARPLDRPGNPAKGKADDRSRSRSCSRQREPPKRIEVPRLINRPTPPSSPESKRSNPFSDTDTDSSWSHTSEEDDRGRHQVRGPPVPGKGGFHGQPEFFGVKGNVLPHRQRQFPQHHIDDPSGGLPSFAPRMQMIPDLEEVRAEAYLAGKADAQRDARELVVETLAQVTAPQLPQLRRERPPPRVLNDVDFEGRMGGMRIDENEYEDDGWSHEVDDRRPRFLVPIRSQRAPDYRDDRLRRGNGGFDNRSHGQGIRVRRGVSLDDGQYIVMSEKGRDDGVRSVRVDHIGARVREGSHTRMSPTGRDIGEADFAYGTSRAPPPPRAGAQGLGRREVEFDDDYVVLSKVPGRV